MWRMDKYLRRLDVRVAHSCVLHLVHLLLSGCNIIGDKIYILSPLQAALVVADKTQSLQITGNGDVLEPHDGIIAIGSGSPYALAAARALIDVPGMDALTIAKKAMVIAADACIYTNKNFTALHIAEGGEIKDIDLVPTGTAASG